jgi:hypothetical protein
MLRRIYDYNRRPPRLYMLPFTLAGLALVDYYFFFAKTSQTWVLLGIVGLLATSSAIEGAWLVAGRLRGRGGEVHR